MLSLAHIICTFQIFNQRYTDITQLQLFLNVKILWNYIDVMGIILHPRCLFTCQTVSEQLQQICAQEQRTCLMKALRVGLSHFSLWRLLLEASTVIRAVDPAESLWLGCVPLWTGTPPAAGPPQTKHQNVRMMQNTHLVLPTGICNSVESLQMLRLSSFSFYNNIKLNIWVMKLI